MRIQLFFILVLLNCFSLKILSQLIVNAGTDKVMCVNLYGNDTITLGANPTSTGGSNNYVYSWYCVDSLSDSHFKLYSSYFLDDTSSANPKVIKSSPFSIKSTFYLKVIDTTNNLIGFDSTVVVFSRKYYSMGMESFLSKGDSILLRSSDLVGSDLPLDSVEWFPKGFLSRPYASETWAKPQKFTIYTVYIKDTAGCEAFPTSEHVLYVLSVNTNEISADKPLIYDQTSNSLIILDNLLLNEETKIIVVNMKGQILINKIINGNKLELGHSSGLIIYIIIRGNTIIRNGKLLTF